MKKSIPYILILTLISILFSGIASVVYLKSINDSLHVQEIQNLKKEKNELIIAMAKNNKLYHAFKQVFPESILQDKSKYKKMVFYQTMEFLKL